MKTCCPPCEEKDLCTTTKNCCLECHFTYEEQNAMPHLPPELQQQLIAEHQWLVANNFPPEQMAIHSQQEMEWFRQYVPPAIVAQIDRDHHYYEHGQLPSRDWVENAT